MTKNTYLKHRELLHMSNKRTGNPMKMDTRLEKSFYMTNNYI